MNEKKTRNGHLPGNIYMLLLLLSAEMSNLSATSYHLSEKNSLPYIRRDANFTETTLNTDYWASYTGNFKPESRLRCRFAQFNKLSLESLEER